VEINAIKWVPLDITVRNMGPAKIFSPGTPFLTVIPRKA
jgi:hypothetical protein